MKNFKINHLNTQWKKAAILGALVLSPALSLTNTAEAAPRPQAPAWNNQRFEQNRSNNRVNNNRFDNNRQNIRRADSRFDNQRNDSRYDNRRNDNNDGGNDTIKLLGAGIIGAIIGAVVSR